MEQNEQTLLRHLSITCVLGNLLLTLFKLAAGVLGRSAAMVSDGVHSLSDVLASVIAAVGARMGRRGADNRHPYGHERMESLASLLLGLMLAATAVLIGINSVKAALSAEKVETPGLLPLIAAVVSIGAKEWMYRDTMRCARLLRSPAFEADAKHHRSDALSSVGSFIGILGARLGIALLDPAASAVIALLIARTAFEILSRSADELLDTACDPDTEKALGQWIAAQEGVRRVDLLTTRRFGNRVYVDAEIAVDGDRTLREAHAVADRVHDSVETHFTDVKHIMIHVNPF